MPKNSKREAVADRQITIDRLVAAPRALVFKAWTDPDHIGLWWGPDGFTTTTKTMDVRPGGAWRFTMHGPDGTDYPNLIEYTEVTPPERIAFVHSDDGGGMTFHSEVTFTEEPGGTRVKLSNIFATKADRDMVVREHNAIEGGKQTLARMAAYIEQVSG
jgi:uncharacterized protein YndB with AHSA1/START domain